MNVLSRVLGLNIMLQDIFEWWHLPYDLDKMIILRQTFVQKHNYPFSYNTCGYKKMDFLKYLRKFSLVLSSYLVFILRIVTR